MHEIVGEDVVARVVLERLQEDDVAINRHAAQTLTARLDPAPAEERHARGMSDRRVVVEEADDGMSWIMPSCRP